MHSSLFRSIRATPLVLRRAKSAMPVQSYTERMDKTGRPISPHVWPSFMPAAGVAPESRGFIYKLPAIAWASITMRITGIFLTAGASGVGLMALGSSDAPAELASSIASSSLAPIAKFGVAFTGTFHALGAVRHTIWDKTAKGFSNTMMLQSSYAILGATTLIALGLSAYSLPPPKEDKK